MQPVTSMQLKQDIQDTGLPVGYAMTLWLVV